MTIACRGLTFAAVLSLLLPNVSSAQTIFSASGPNAAAIQPTVDQYRANLGTLNANSVGSVGSGRREINWDGVPDVFSSPNNLPGDFFNVNSPRGVVFSTPGTGFRVSANANNPTSTPIEFGEIDPRYPDNFTTFSAQRLFTAIGSNIVDVNFFIPGTNVAAVTRGFGAVFSDVDIANTSSIQYFDVNNVSLGTFFVPAAPGPETLSFLGVSFGSAVISRVRITAGNQILAPGNNSADLVVLDDFIYGEPVPFVVPEPSSFALIAVGGLALAVRVARRRRGNGGSERRPSGR